MLARPRCKWLRLAACFLPLFATACPSLSEIGTGGGDSGARDGGPNAPDAGRRADADRRDADRRDAAEGGPVDGGDAGDATGDGEAGRADCAADSANIFCDDFDHGPFASRWDSYDHLGGTLSLDSDAAVSPPEALLASIPHVASDAGYAPWAQLLKNFAGDVKSLSCSFDFRLDSFAPGAHDVSILNLELFSSEYQVYLLTVWLDRLGNPGTSLEESGLRTDGGVVANSLPGQDLTGASWKHVTFDLTLGGDGTGSASLTVNGGPGVHMALAPPSSVESSTWSQGVGYADTTSATSPTSLRYDNVECILAY